MSRVVILGAGISGHTAALHLRRRLGRAHEVVVVSPNSRWNWIPSNIWVGVGKMTAEDVTFELAPIYRRKGIDFHQALATELHPEGTDASEQPSVTIRYTDPARAGEVASITYDYLINATGPRLNFAATPGLGPDGNTVSVCTPAMRSSCSTLNVYSKAAPSQVHVPCPTPITRRWRSPRRSREMTSASWADASSAWAGVHTDTVLPSGPSPGVAAKFSRGPVALIR